MRPEAVKDKKSKIPATRRRNVMMDCFRKGIAVVNCGKSVIRLMPPLAITQDLVDKSLDILDASIGAM
jgi:4-aminobutyrate aminotransferase-like enzyme